MAGTKSEYSVGPGMYGYVYQERFHRPDMVYIPHEMAELRERVYREVSEHNKKATGAAQERR